MNRLPILLIGGGGHCRSCIDVIEATRAFEVVGIVEANQQAKNNAAMTEPNAYPIVGIDADLPKLIKQTPYCHISLGYVHSPNHRERLFTQLKALGAKFPVIISPHAYVSATAKIGEGTIVMHQALVNAHAKVGQNNIINSQSLVEHDCSLGHHVHIATGAKINGQVKVGDGCMIGSQSVVLQGVTLTAQSIIGAGSVVVKDIDQAGVYKGLLK